MFEFKNNTQKFTEEKNAVITSIRNRHNEASKIIEKSLEEIFRPIDSISEDTITIDGIETDNMEKLNKISNDLDALLNDLL